jgi:D-beta-D-heptose 7-phosphate kinase/D-beta-D-heptose 1-phosphate adenosyltransferase
MSDLARIVAGFSGRSVAVVGDVMLDHFVIGRVDRISPEAPVPVVRFEREEFRLGGGANVAHNLHALGGRVALLGVVGHDKAAEDLRRQLDVHGLSDESLIVDATRPTTCKMRVVTSRNQQVARIDHEHDDVPPAAVVAALMNAIVAAAGRQHAIVLSDYRKGVVSPEVIDAAAAAAAVHHIPLLIDPKVAEPDRYRGASLLTPNHHEAELMTRTTIRTDADASRAARAIHDRTGSSVIITRGEHGMWVLDASQPTAVETSLPALAREVSDVTGAGDTVIAVLALAMAAGAPLIDAARLANIAAGIVVGRFGTAAVDPATLVATLAGER